MNAVRPNYGAASLTGVVPALLGRSDASWLPSCVQGASSVVLFVLDGFGWSTFERHRAQLPAMSGMEGGAITTVVPSTTSAALPSITTGVPPAEHGLLGYRLRVDGDILNVLRWRLQDGRPGPTPSALAPITPFFGMPVPIVTRQEFCDSGFSEAFMRGGRFWGWRTTSGLIGDVRRLVQGGERFVFAYYDGIDYTAHRYGLEDFYFSAELITADRLIGDLLNALPSEAAVVVTSDHGQVHLDGQLPLDPVAQLVTTYAGEARFRSLFAVAGASADLVAAAAEHFGPHAWVFSREQLIDEGWLGPKAPEKGVASRLGDVILAARDSGGFADPTYRGEATLRSGHGSLTADEMLVPLLAGRGTDES